MFDFQKRDMKATFRAGLFVVALAVLTVGQVKPALAGLSSGDTEIYKAAFRAVDARKFKDAIRIASKANDKLVGKKIYWAYLKEPRSGATFEEITTFIRNNPHWPHLNTLRKRVEQVMPANLDDQKVMSWFANYDPMTLDGMMRWADALMRAGDDAKVAEIVRKAWVDEFFTATRERQFMKKFSKYLTKQDHLDRMDRLLWDHHTRSARRMLKRVDATTRKLAEARMALYRRRGNVDAYIAKVPKAHRNDPGLMFERVNWRRSKGLNEGAREILLTPPADPGNARKWWRERDLQVRRALESGKSVLAYDLASKHQQTGGASYAEAEFLAGWIALNFLDLPEKGFTHFKNLHDEVNFPISLARGAYWAGRAASQDGRPQDAQYWFRKAAEHTTTFYGQLAYVELHQDAKLSFPDRPRITMADTNNFRKSELIAITNDLAQIGRLRAIDPFVLHSANQNSTPGYKELVAMQARRLGRFDLSVSISRRALKQQAPLLLEGYPIVSYATDQGAEKSLVNAIIRQESNFKVGARSVANARGLMQVLPSTARSVTRKLGMPYSSKRLLSDPDYNVRIGHAYITYLLDKYDGSYVLALAAYNAGPGRVSQWLRRYGDPRKNIDVVNWIERIPFTETRSYVQRVLENLAVYRTRTQDFPFDSRIEEAWRNNRGDEPKTRQTAQAWNSFINSVAWTANSN